jgi:hypothetical protein
MSEDVYEAPGLIVTRFCGPASEGDDRQRWHLSTDYCVLTREQIRKLAWALLNESDPE